MANITPAWHCAVSEDPVASLGRKRQAVMDHGTLRDVCLLLAGSGAGLAEHADLPIPIRKFRNGDSLFHEGAIPEWVYVVRSGTFKTFRTELDGYEQVLGFSGRGDLLAFDALGLPSHPSAAVSLEDSTVYALTLHDLYELCEVAPRFDRVVHAAESAALRRQAELAGVMSAAASEVRLARFLLILSAKMAAHGESPRRLRLRMSRRDIASYLGVAHETISRCFQALADARLLTVRDREVELLDLDAMPLFAQGTRRHHGSSSRAVAAAARRAAEPAMPGDMPPADSLQRYCSTGLAGLVGASANTESPVLRGSP